MTYGSYDGSRLILTHLHMYVCVHIESGNSGEMGLRSRLLREELTSLTQKLNPYFFLAFLYFSDWRSLFYILHLL